MFVISANHKWSIIGALVKVDWIAACIAPRVVSLGCNLHSPLASGKQARKPG